MTSADLLTSGHALHSPFGADTFGRRAEAFARWFGTPTFLLGQTAIVALWIATNIAVLTLRWDPYPFILLNLAFSLQAAYAAPLILLAQTRQADRDKAINQADTAHREQLAATTLEHQRLLHDQALATHRLLIALTERIGASPRPITETDQPENGRNPP
jgi:uncharacterized membrane protein